MGRRKLTDREKLNAKLERLQKEIQEIRTKLSLNLAGDLEEKKLTLDEVNPEDIERRDGYKPEPVKED